MEYKYSPYFKVGRASELSGGDRYLYRFLEMVPGLLSWGTIVLVVLLSIYKPVLAAIFIILFDLYWLLKTMYLSTHNLHNWRRLRANMKLDWKEKIANLKYEHIYHLVMLPYFEESEEVIEESLKSLQKARFDHKKLLVVLASEERAGEKAYRAGLNQAEKFKDYFGGIIVTKHPDAVVGEMPGKGSNISYAAEEVRTKLLDAKNISYDNVIVSAFDVDTVVYPDYFLCLTWYFLTTDRPNHVSFQPVPLYNNNIWTAPALSRVVAFSNTFWQMIQQERPEKLVTFSSHAVSFASLYNVNYWQKNMVSEDSRIFWNLFLANNGDYKVIPITYPVSMDANEAETRIQTLKNIYKQQRRWMWGAENVPYLLMGCIKNGQIPFWKKIKTIMVQLEGYWSASTNPLLILLLGWLPLIFGGKAFRATVLSYNLPLVTRDLMILAMLGLISLAVMTASFLPKVPENLKVTRWKRATMFLQWILVPITIVIFGSIPALEAQTRLMFGKYLGFWVTPKYRK
jgi:hypothetical protein